MTSATAVVEVPEPARTAAEAAERLLRADAVGTVRLSGEDDGTAEFVGLGRPVADPAAPASVTPVQAAGAHLDRYGALLGVDEPDSQLEPTAVVDAAGGSHVVKFTQRVDGLPVIGGELAVSVDADGDLEAVNGETTDTDVVAPAPSARAAAAVRTAVTTTARRHGVKPSTLTAGPARQWYFDPELVGSPDPLGPRPVWRVEVSDGAGIDQLVLIDTATGRVAESVNQVMHANIRVVCNRPDQAPGAVDQPCLARDYARAPGRASAVAAANRVFDFAGDTWTLFNALGRDLNQMVGHNAGDGRKVRLTVNLPADMRNAFWNGREAYFSTGLATDDVVAHELTHGVVQHTANLFPAYQSGAINESMADVFGELVDQRNGNTGQGQTDWLVGEDTSLGALRNMRVPGRFGDPDRMRSPRFAADPQFRDLGGVHTNSGVGNKAAFLIAQGGRFNGRTIRGLDRGLSDRRKTGRIYLRALQMLTSGSDYADLGRVLPQACRRLAGTGARRITGNDCAQVRRAVAATQMLAQPRNAAAPEAPRCSPRNAASRRLFSDNFERPASRAWTLGRLWSRRPRQGAQLTDLPYATSGRRSLFGLNPDPSLGDPAATSVTLRRAVRVPAGRRTRTFLRFDHAYVFEFLPGPRFLDGGLVEYSTNRGRTWRSASGLRWVNGPRQRIVLGPGPGGFRGFGGDSHGYQSSRVDLSRFAGRTLRLRWTMRADASVGYLGWWLDDIDVYTCRRR
ncbi:MAG TPA: M4 family metallopeptidase [Nocardioidaceae bacterium]|nr:M4 family metallopeptidase [Nocardioidaceae bacterium]